MNLSRKSDHNDKSITRALQERLSAYQRPSAGRSAWQIVNSFIPYLILWYVSWRVMEYSFWLALPSIVLASAFLVRIFIICHDCGHQAFFASRKTNEFWGRITGALTFTPYHYWHVSHARHHATSGNLDKRGYGDVWMMTTDEYLHASRSQRLKYRLYRHPFVMFVLGPLLITLVTHRKVRAGSNRRERNSVWTTNLAILLIAVAGSLVMGVKEYVVIQALTLFFAHVAGVWLFYVQHQFEGVYWEREAGWDFVAASLAGGSFYKLPRVLMWFTGNIGYHHVHHLNSRIPNYNLPKCHQQIPTLQTIKPVTLIPSLKSLRYRLWDEDRGEMVGFRALRRRQEVSSQ